MSRQISNWNHTFTQRVADIRKPATQEELRTLVLETKNSVRVVGATRHTFNEISLGDERTLMIDMSGLDRLLNIGTHSVRVEAGMSLAALNRHLKNHGKSLANMGGADFQSIGGLVTTATHGSSFQRKFPSGGTVSDLVLSLKVLSLDGETHHLTPGSPDFDAFLCSLGACGIILEVELSILEGFALQEEIIDVSEWLNLNENELLNHIHRGLTNNDHFELIFFPLIRALAIRQRNRRPLPEVNCWQNFIDPYFDDLATWVSQVGAYCGQCCSRTIVHAQELAFRSIVGTSVTKESARCFIRNDLHGGSNITEVMDAEYALEIEALPQAIKFLLTWASQNSDLALASSIRFDIGNTSLLGPSSNRPTVYVDCSVLDRNFRHHEIQAFMLSLGGRPHWGKWQNLTYRQVENLYGKEKLERFLEISANYDPKRKGWNPFLHRLLTKD